MWANPKIATAPEIPAAKFSDIKKGTVKRLEKAASIKTVIKIKTAAVIKEAKIVVKFFISDKF